MCVFLWSSAVFFNFLDGKIFVHSTLGHIPEELASIYLVYRAEGVYANADYADNGWTNYSYALHLLGIALSIYTAPAIQKQYSSHSMLDSANSIMICDPSTEICDKENYYL